MVFVWRDFKMQLTSLATFFLFFLSIDHSECASGKRLVCYFSSDSPRTKGYGRYTANEIPVELCSDVIYRGLGFPQWTRGTYTFDVSVYLSDVLRLRAFTELYLLRWFTEQRAAGVWCLHSDDPGPITAGS